MIPGRFVFFSHFPNFLPRIKRFDSCRKSSFLCSYSDVKQLFSKRLECTKLSAFDQPTRDLKLSVMSANQSLGRTNRLALERSPYLLQHATNPVEWYPWGEEAFEKSRKEGKLIFLSVGYSTCHWCHVMERESFENEEIAKIMNEHFVNIKVDREERPDIDKIYMTFVQASCGGGGWPMSVFLTPDLTPVMGGMYFPPEDKYGRPGFKSVLLSAAKQWKDNRHKCNAMGTKIMDLLRQTTVFDVPMASRLVNGAPPADECWRTCLKQLTDQYESRFGGFGDAPKFPQASNFTFLFHLYARQPKSVEGKRALNMCIHTLRMMARGGIHDHVSQGFARYSTDDKWHVPHFEKMLYDQGQLAVAYSQAYLATKDTFFEEVLRDILTYVSRDLSHEDGGFYSAEDADSLPTFESASKKEGAFCVWTYEDVRRLLSERVILPGTSEQAKTASGKPIVVADVFCHHYNVRLGGNVQPGADPHGELRNQNVLIVFSHEEETAKHFGLPVDVVKGILGEGRMILFEERKKRPRPHLDDKMITSWNALMISGYARAAQALNDDRYLERAVRAAEFAKKYLYDAVNNRLLRSCYRCMDGGVAQISAPIAGFLDDYAFLINALIDLYETNFDPSWLEWALNLQEMQDKLFWDEGSAAYFMSPNTDQSILLRLKEDQDNAEPSGNSVAASNLIRLGTLLDQPYMREKADRLLAAFTSRLTRLPVSLPALTSALMLLHDSPTQVFVTGQITEPDTAALVAVAHSRMVAGRLLALADDRQDSVLYRKSDVIRRLKPQSGRATAYVCHHHACSLPVTSPEGLASLLTPQSADAEEAIAAAAVPTEPLE